jgi:hypothetical protein
MAEKDAKTEPVAAVPAETKVADSPALPASPLAAADSTKHEGAAPAVEVKPDPKANGHDMSAATAAAPEAKLAVETKPETKPDSASETKPDATKSATESGETRPPAEVKAETTPEGEVKSETKLADTKEAPEATPQAPPVYEALKLPDTVKLDKERVAKFDELIGKAELSTKADHAAMSAMRQDLANLYVEEVNRIGQQVVKNQHDVWNRLVEQRVNELKSHPVLGGNRIETTLGNAKYALEGLLPELTKNSPAPFTKQDAADLIKIMDAGGVSHSLLMIKALNGMYEAYREPEPVPGTLPLHATTSKEPGQRGWYDSVAKT